MSFYSVMHPRQKTILKIILTLCFVTGSLLFVQVVFAQFGVNEVGNVIALPSEDPRIIAARIVRAALGFLGLIALVIVLYGGFVWMTSAGIPERIEKAKKILTNGLIGLIIIVFAFAITQWVLNTLIGRYPTPGVAGPPAGPPVVGAMSGALGNGIVESHYPPRGGVGIPRNTKIIVTFKEQMSLESIINNYNDNDTPTNIADDTVVKNDNGTPAIPADDWMEVKVENIKIYKSIDGETAALTANQIKVTFTPDLKTFVFDPVELLGSPSENIWYSVALKPGIKKVDGSDAFIGAFHDGYAWDFETSTIIDTTPPQVESTIPDFRSTTREQFARNIVIQINFDEAIDPTTVSGEWPTSGPTFPPFIEVKRADGTPIAGTWKISNQYKTAEFVPREECGTNACGDTIYCLPASTDIDVLVKAATLGEAPPEAQAPYDGIVDVAGNSLNGDKDDRAEGPPTDNLGIGFRTSAEMDITSPWIEWVAPAPGASEVLLDKPIEILFSEFMMISTFNSENIILEDNQAPACAVWFTLSGPEVDASGSLPPSPRPATWRAAKHKAIIDHGEFIESVEDEPGASKAYCGKDEGGNDVFATSDVSGYLSHVSYYPRVTHGVKDLYQNCFFKPEGPESPPKAWKCVIGEPGCPSPLPWE